MLTIGSILQVLIKKGAVFIFKNSDLSDKGVLYKCTLGPVLVLLK